MGSGDEVWVGSGDDDFTLESSKTHALLHPRLRRELLARTNVAPLAFRTLADVGTAFRRKNPRASTHIPTAEALDRARLQERAADQLSLSDGIGGRSDLTGTVDVNSMLRAALSQLPAGVLYGETEWVPQPPTEEFAKAIAALVAEKKGSNKK